MPFTDEGTNLTYTNANTLISGDVSRSTRVSFRANTINADNIIFSIGSSLTTSNDGCNTHFALSVINSSHVTIYGMCGAFDNSNIALIQSVLYDGSFHQICVTYNNTNSSLCIYLDLQSSQCITRTNVPYNTSPGDVRIGWWPDPNRPFLSLGGGSIRLLSLFNHAINQSCVAYQYQVNSVLG